MRQPAKGWRLLCVRAATLLLVVLICGGGLSAHPVLTSLELRANIHAGCHYDEPVVGHYNSGDRMQCGTNNKCDPEGLIPRLGIGIHIRSMTTGCEV